MDWIMSRTVEQIPLGVSIGEESFSYLDYADDVTLLAEMLETLVEGLLVLQDEVAPLGLRVNWTKSKIQHAGEPRLTQSTVQVAAENVQLVDEFVYLGSLISHDRGIRGQNSATHHDRKGMLLPPREEHLEVPRTNRH